MKLKAALEHAQLGSFAQGDHDARIVLAHFALTRNQTRNTVADHVHCAVPIAGQGGGAQLMQERPGEQRRLAYKASSLGQRLLDDLSRISFEIGHYIQILKAV